MSANKKNWSLIITGAIAIMLSSAAMADVFAIRTFVTLASGNVVTDLFNDGMPPPSGPLGVPNYYSVSAPAAIGPEQNEPNPSDIGGLTIRPGLGNLNFSATGDTLYRSVGVSPRLSFLQGTMFGVAGIYDSVTPAHNKDFYGIRLQNFGPGGGSDVVTFGVSGTPTGMMIALYQQDFVAHTNTLLASYIPTLADLSEPQILLDLFHDENAGNSVTASFCFFDLDLGNCSITTLGVGTVFAHTNWTVPAFNAAEVVPEPGTIALLCVALAGVGLFRRRELH